MLIPFAAIAAFAAKNLSELAGMAIGKKAENQIKTLIAGICAFYVCLNIFTAKSLDIFLQKNDYEWIFLINSQKQLKNKYIIQTPNYRNERSGIAAKYFSARHDTSNPPLFYISQDDIRRKEIENENNENYPEKIIPFKEYAFPERLITSSKETSDKNIRKKKAGFYKIPLTDQSDKNKKNSLQD